MWNFWWHVVLASTKTLITLPDQDSIKVYWSAWPGGRWKGTREMGLRWGYKDSHFVQVTSALFVPNVILSSQHALSHLALTLKERKEAQQGKMTYVLSVGSDVCLVISQVHPETRFWLWLQASPNLTMEAEFCMSDYSTIKGESGEEARCVCRTQASSACGIEDSRWMWLGCWTFQGTFSIQWGWLGH